MRLKALLIMLTTLLFLAGVVWADGVPTIEWWVISGAGSSASNGSYHLSGALGQPVVGTVVYGTSYLCAGFWCGAIPDYVAYLPLVMSQ